MASNCEALQIGKQQVMSNFMAAQSIPEDLESCMQDSIQAQELISYSSHVQGHLKVILHNMMPQLNYQLT